MVPKRGLNYKTDYLWLLGI